MSTELQILARTAEFSVGVYENVSIAIWHRAVTLESIELCNRSMLMAARAPGGTFLMSVVEQITAPPSEAARQALMESLRYASSANPSAVAVAIESRGFLSVAARSLVTGVLLAVRPSFPCRCFAKAEQIPGWFGTFDRHSRGVFAQTLQDHIADLRRPPSMQSVA